ncbi:hypothetical protein, partial [Kitasatospora sp. NPDC059803]|uniref:hypothetical protein n=1 Tax=Kitasatospora sp. NPDC059803 TaxID=3346953 RepID=UPI003651990A
MLVVVALGVRFHRHPRVTDIRLGDAVAATAGRGLHLALGVLRQDLVLAGGRRATVRPGHHRQPVRIQLLPRPVVETLDEYLVTGQRTQNPGQAATPQTGDPARLHETALAVTRMQSRIPGPAGDLDLKAGGSAVLVGHAADHAHPQPLP